MQCIQIKREYTIKTDGTINILVVDDDEDSRDLFLDFLKHFGYNVTVAENGKEGIAFFRKKRFDVVITDLQMPGMNGKEVIASIKSIQEDALIFITTGTPFIQTTNDALELGAIDYFAKPIDFKSLHLVLERSLKIKRLMEEINTSKNKSGLKTSLCEMTGSSLAINLVYRQIEKLASSDITVLLQGETGSGKELVAEALHKLSRRKDGNFIPVQCGALSETLLESQLFGYLKGSFTGALSDKPGFFSYADGGTIFLDEIEVASPKFQVALLRAIDKKEIVPVGGNSSQKVNVRVIVASNIDLESMVAEKRFREDLFFRITSGIISIPPLRERKEDIPLLTHKFFEDVSSKGQFAFSPHSLVLLKKYLWPGNVRELKNLVVNLSRTAPHNLIRPIDLPEKIRRVDSQKEIFPTIDEHVKDLLIRVLEYTSGNKTETARILGVAKNTIYALMTKHHLT